MIAPISAQVPAVRSIRSTSTVSLARSRCALASSSSAAAIRHSNTGRSQSVSATAMRSSWSSPARSLHHPLTVARTAGKPVPANSRSLLR